MLQEYLIIIVMFSAPVSPHCFTACAVFQYQKKIFDLILKIWNCKIKIQLEFHKCLVEFVRFFPHLYSTDDPLPYY